MKRTDFCPPCQKSSYCTSFLNLWGCGKAQKLVLSCTCLEIPATMASITWVSLRGFLLWWAHLAQNFKECSFRFIGLSPCVQLRKERSLPGCNWKGSLGQWPWEWRSLRGSQSRALWAPQRRAGRRGGRREERDQVQCHWTDRGPLPSIPWWCQGLLLPLQPHLMRWGG